VIDLRSDTVTRPTSAMLAAMTVADVGDDVFGDDPSVNGLQLRVASLFDMEAALFCPTGTMTNQIAIQLHTQSGDEVICDELSHVYLNECGGIAVHSRASTRTLRGLRGQFTAEDVLKNINRRDDPQYARSRLVVIENTVTRGGGSCWSLAEIRRIRSVCDQNRLVLHLDGARLFNALVAKAESPADYGRIFDTISICLSKGLGAPAGSVLVGSNDDIDRARRVRKLMGGAMRQAGYLAAAGLHALDHHVERLRLDHTKARNVEEALRPLAYVERVLPAETNIVIFALSNRADPSVFATHLADRHIKALRIAPRTFRFVFHLDVTDSDVNYLIESLRVF
jgi:threonine aldolase